MAFHTILGFQDAVAVAADAGGPDVDDEYTRGQVELIVALFIRGDPDPGSGEALAFTERAIRDARR